MAAVVPYGDPDLAALRGEIVPPPPGQPDGLLDLGGFYGLHPALTGHARHVPGARGARLCTPSPAIPRAQPFRGAGLPGIGADHRMTSGWLNRAVAALPPVGNTPARRVTPLPSASPCHCCCAGRRWWRTGRRTASPSRRPSCTRPSPHSIKATRSPARRLPKACAPAASAPGSWRATNEAERHGTPSRAWPGPPGRCWRAPDGPRIAALEIGGWDTHTGSGQPAAPAR